MTPSTAASDELFPPDGEGQKRAGVGNYCKFLLPLWVRIVTSLGMEVKQSGQGVAFRLMWSQL